MSEGIGQPVRRVEDERFLTGTGKFTDDLRFAGEAHAAVARSPHAHARLRGIDIQAARAAPGVLAVYTGEDLAAAGMRPIPALTRTAPYALANRDGTEMPDPPHWPLARGKVRHVGDPVAFVVAETVAEARAAAEFVAVDYEPLPAAVEAEAALRPGAPRVWDDLPGNLSFEWVAGDHAVADAAFAGAARVVRVEVVNSRQIVAFMEPRAIAAHYDPAEDRTTIHVGSQSAHGVRDLLAHVLDLAPERLRVLTPARFSTPNSPSRHSPPAGLAGPSGGRPTAPRPSPPIPRRATMPSMASLPSTPRAASSPSASPPPGGTGPTCPAAASGSSPPIWRP